MEDWSLYIQIGIGIVAFYIFVFQILGLRVISNEKMGICEKWWAFKGSLKDGIISLHGEAGYLPEVLRGGIHFKPGFLFKVHIYPLITIPQGQIAYVFARSGEVLPTTQLLGRVVPESDNFQSVRGFLVSKGQKGPQRGILREGTYALNLAQFIVITKDTLYYLPLGDRSERAMLENMKQDIYNRGGFEPVLIRGSHEVGVNDMIGVITVQDGPSLPNGEIIAPIVGDDKADPHYHNNFQNPENFLLAGGYKGKQLQVLTDGTYYINRLFATVEMMPKTIVPVGFVGVVVSYTGSKGDDTTGADYKHGELVKRGCKGVWEEPLMPGKYPLNQFAMEVKLVPTTNIILKWHSAEVGEHKYDENLVEIDLITKDAFQPSLPLSVVMHIDYKMAPWVIQRFGDMTKLVNQTLDPLIASYFKNIGQVKTLIELIHQRREIQETSTEEMKRKFANYNLELEEVLIGTPQASKNDTQMNIVLEQLRQRQVAEEQVKTFDSQQKAAEKKRSLKEAEAVAEQQSFLTQSQINIEIETNRGRAEAQKAEQDAAKIRTIALAEGDKTVTLGKADAERIRNIGNAEASAIEAQVSAYGGPQYQLTQKILEKFSDAVAQAKIDIVPKTVVNMGGGDGQTPNALESLLKLLISEKFGINLKPVIQSEKPFDSVQQYEAIPVIAEEPKKLDA